VSNGISPQVDRFIHEHISSIEQLEVLLLLHDDPHKYWSAAEISRVLYRQPASVSERLEQLHAAQLLEVQRQEPPLFCFNTQTPHRDVVWALDRAYKERKDTVIRLVFTKPRDHLRAFSDAFRLRKD
jgi:hypothetical protein